MAKLFEAYSISGREHLVARGVLSYYKLIQLEKSNEWMAYLNTGRTGRIDTQEVRRCLGDLTNQILSASKAEPLDPKRFFPSEMRELIFKNSGGRCRICAAELSLQNFHADHVKPHSQGGATVVSNGQALCTACNHQKGSTWKDLLGTGAGSPSGLA